MSTRAGLVAGLLVACCCLAGAPAVRADEPAASPHVQGMMRKLGRGLASIATCWAEIPRTAYHVGQEQGLLPEMSVGLVQGVGRTVLRAASGVFDVVTFYSDAPNDFEPLMKPEYVWANGEWAR